MIVDEIERDDYNDVMADDEWCFDWDRLWWNDQDEPITYWGWDSKHFLHDGLNCSVWSDWPTDTYYTGGLPLPRSY